MDWKRICCRRKQEPEEGAAGGVVLYSDTIEAPAEIKACIATLPENEQSKWTIYLEKKTYIVCKLSAEKVACPVYVRKTAAKATQGLIQEGVRNIIIEDGYMAEWVAEAVVVGSYQYDVLHSKKKTQVNVIYGGSDAKVEKAIVSGEAQNFARFLVDTPANLMTPTLFTEYAKEYLPKEVEVKVYGKSELAKMKMNLLLGVSNGSAEEPKLLEIKYLKGDQTVALVGKGVTFDSGGISLKPSAKMALMKGDMAGGASVVATIGALARLSAKTSVIGIIPLTENLPSGTATKPGDVHVGAAGKSVEVDNTDAEGRLILGDALHHALSFNPAKIVDVATLTGAMSVALGAVMAGLFTNSDELGSELLSASACAADPIWRMPVTDDYKSLISSDVADIKNIGGPAGGSITAALFLKEFVGTTPWAHLDIAGVAGSTLTPELHGKGATGRPVKLLVHWLAKE
ncbi:cytosol aminopeptidase [Nematocida displodere]|uniref:leucyl aminopeptidase n=1 Tax=Nematocida displodere TaxID=1805483 RepID=A0A177EE13_9MICR|nr:cytosol aminopeptidase [Nematocida displodere]